MAGLYGCIAIIYDVIVPRLNSPNQAQLLVIVLCISSYDRNMHFKFHGNKDVIIMYVVIIGTGKRFDSCCPVLTLKVYLLERGIS